MRLAISDIRRKWLLPMLTLCLGLSSCIYDDGTMTDEPDIPADSYMVVLSMRLKQDTPGSDVLSRVGEIWGDNDNREDGVGVDNYVDIDGTLRVGVYDAAGNLAAQVKRVLAHSWKDEENNENKITETRHYECRGVMELTDGNNNFPNGEDYTVMLFLNTPGTDNLPVTLDDTKKLAYSRYGVAAKVRNDGGIPMWGFITSKFEGIKQGETYQLRDDIYMLRALSKVRLFVSADSKGWAIKSLTVNNINGTGYSLPLWTVGTDKMTTDLTLAGSLRPYADSNIQELAKYDYVSNPENDFVFYMPEKENKTPDDAKKCKMYVTVTDGTTDKSKYVEFMDYTGDGKPTYNYLDIIRNHYYNFEILCGNKDEELRFRVTIADMQKGGDYVFDY